jgi:outer membrane receptor protein involved in Fe transport
MHGPFNLKTHRRAKYLSFDLVIIIILTFSTYLSAEPQQARNLLSISGTILDQTGSAIAGAEVTLYDQANPLAQTKTATDGRFIFKDVRLKQVTLVVHAPGFAPVRQKWTIEEKEPEGLQIVLAPAAFNEQVVVTPTRTESLLRDTAASIRVLNTDELNSNAALRVDDVLRQIPGFQLFRRSGSRTANPTSQGVSLRGVGASGASRSLVLSDGIPLNDPFGAWVYWSRLPRQSLSRIEVMRGAASDVYGSGALGGVINLISKKPDTPTISFEASYGNQNTPDASLFVGTRSKRWSTSLGVESFKTDGYFVVPETERGWIDRPANSRNAVLDFKLQFEKSSESSFFIGTSYFGESRQNGTPFQINRTHIRQISSGADWETGLGAFGLRAYFATQVFDQNFSAVALDRNSETATRVQRVPAQVTGLTLHWSRAFGTRHIFVSGIDAREVRGSSDELVFIQGRPASLVGAGGREHDVGFYIKDALRLSSRFSVSGGVRVDRWRNFLAHSDTRSLSSNGSSRVEQFINRSETAVSPQLSFIYRPDNKFAFFGSIYRGFRAPTLNELYRSFRVGNVLTLANSGLSAEQLSGAEAGLSFTSLEGRLVLRSSFFSSEIDRSIANITLGITPEQITRERRNVGQTRSRGFEAEAEIRLGPHWDISGGYLFADARVVRFSGASSLEGLSLPQIPRHTLTIQLRYSDPKKLNFGLQTRILGQQFDDDLNRFGLPGYVNVDGIVSRALSKNLEIFVAAENLFNQQYMVGRTPTTTVGPPLLVRAGFRFRSTGK